MLLLCHMSAWLCQQITVYLAPYHHHHHHLLCRWSFCCV
jgi:hypothetical protein